MLFHSDRRGKWGMAIVGLVALEAISIVGLENMFLFMKS
jgi:hypothetical protein